MLVEVDNMNVINISKGTELGECDVADSFFSRLRGVMFKDKLERGLILKLPHTRTKAGSAIHMFFVRFPLDIIFTDKNRKVIDSFQSIHGEHIT